MTIHNSVTTPLNGADQSTGQNLTRSILVVDDDPTLRKIMQVILYRQGYEVVTAQNGSEALTLVEQRTFDLILLDWMMPGINGLETCRRLRKISSADDIPIILVTARESFSDKTLAFSVGCADYITKPINAVELQARVKRHIEQTQKRRILHEQPRMLEGVISNQSSRLDQVRTGQTQLLADPAAFPEIQCAVRFQPALEAGGDFYDIVRLGQQCYGFLVADVAGHDLATAYLTGAMKALTVSFTNESLTPHETMLMLNSSLNRFFAPEQYATAIYLKFSQADMTIEIANAGHPNPIIQRAEGRSFFLEMVGDVLGMFDIVECQVQKIKVNTGDRIYLFSDGLLENWPGAGNRQEGANKLSQKIAERHKAPLNFLVTSVVDELISDCGGRVDDDLVLMGIEF
jgi:phosphoserine phosphatase RsbU/P